MGTIDPHATQQPVTVSREQMKTLFLLRHAKSSWADPDLKDFERPLSARGAEDVPLAANRFLARHAGVDCIICSPATRTKMTAKLFAKQIHYPVDDIVSNPELYFAGAPMFLKATRLVDANCNSAMLIGHNQAITEFVNEIANAGIINLPTCGLVEVELPIDNWADAQMGIGKLIDFDYPKKHL
jgi:phosphohistidine phosphatase